MSKKRKISEEEAFEARKQEKTAADNRYSALLLSGGFTAFFTLLYFRNDFSQNPTLYYVVLFFMLAFAVLFILCLMNYLRGRK